MNSYDPLLLAHLVDLEASEASNDSLGPTFRWQGSTSAPAATAGWDPFDVWRTRIRDARRDAPAP